MKQLASFIIRFALSLHYALKSAYSFVADSGFFVSTIRKNMCDYIHWCDI